MSCYNLEKPLKCVWWHFTFNDEVVRKIISKGIVVLTSQLAKLIKIVNKRNKTGKFVSLIWLHKSIELIAEINGLLAELARLRYLNPLCPFVGWKQTIISYEIRVLFKLLVWWDIMSLQISSWSLIVLKVVRTIW